MATTVCRVQFLDDTDPFNSTNFPEPTRPPVYSFRNDIPLISQIPGVYRLLKAPHKIDNCTLQLSHNGVYLDLESTLEEQINELEGFLEETGRGKKNSIILRTKLSIRVHACIEKLYSSDGRELRRALFSLKQVFQDDKDLVQEFVNADGLPCLVKVGTESDQNYQNYILRALGQIMLYVDGMNGIINHNETIQWLYTLIGSKFRLVVKTSLKLLLVFVEYTETNSHLLAQAVVTCDMKRGIKPWYSAMEILKEKDGVDTELLVYVMTIINKTLAGLPDQDSYYDMSDCLEELGIESISNRYLNKKGADLDLLEQFNIYEATLKHEDGDENVHLHPKVQKERRRSSLGCQSPHGYVRRKSRRHSLQNIKLLSPVNESPKICASPTLASTCGKNKEYISERSCLGGLLTSSFRQHKESLQAERERRRREREERLQRIEREERNKFNHDYLDKREEHRQAREERYKNVEKMAAEEFVQEMKNRTKYLSEHSSSVTNLTKLNSSDYTNEFETHSLLSADLNSEDEKESVMENSKCETDQEATQEYDLAETMESEPSDTMYMEYTKDDTVLSEKEKQFEESNEKDNCSSSSVSSEQGILIKEEKRDETSESETGNMHVHVENLSNNMEEDSMLIFLCLVAQRALLIFNSFLPASLVVLYVIIFCILPNSNNEEEYVNESGLEKYNEDSANEEKENNDLIKKESMSEDGKLTCIMNNLNSVLQNSNPDEIVDSTDETLNNQSSSVTEENVDTDFTCANSSESNVNKSFVDNTLQPKKEFDCIWDQLMAGPKELKIKDMDFTDLGDGDDIDVLNVELETRQPMKNCPPSAPPPPMNCLGLLPPPPPLVSGCFNPVLSSMIPPPLPSCYTQSCESPKLSRNESLFMKKKKTIRLFWNEVRPFEIQSFHHNRYKNCMWSKLETIKLDTSKLEYLFESKSKELPASKKSAAEGKRQEITVLDSKRSNAINIGLTVLPPPRTIKMAILNFDEYALNKEGIDKILTMIPTEEEKQKIQEAQLAHPDIPLGSAEQFLLTLSSITELSSRLQLWAFKMDFELVEKEIAVALFDLKEGMEQLENNKTLICILSSLLAIGNFLNGTNAKGFDLSYLQKVPEVKDTVQKQSLLYHLCNTVVEKFPDSTDLYSEIGAITRSAKVDFDQLQDNLYNLERRCKASWDYLKIIAKHELKSVSKQKMSEFLKDCVRRIIILKTVHRRINNRFHSFLLFMGHPPHSICEVNINRFCKIISEFALEYRTSRDRVLQQKQKWQTQRERNKTRGKIITDTDEEDDFQTGGFSKNTFAKQTDDGLSHLQGLKYDEDSTEHKNMVAMLKISSPKVESATAFGTTSRNRINRGRFCSDGYSTNDVSNHANTSADEIMDHIIESATHVSNQVLPRERKRSRANRRSLRRTLKSGLTHGDSLFASLIASEIQI
ncbi:FH1/FH2 domain-containing protein 3 [Pelodytes ibericus]